jgi:hypothetical protein
MVYDLTTILFIVCGVLILSLFGWVMSLQSKVKKLLIGSGAKNLGDSLTNISGELKDFGTFRTELENYLQTVEKRLRKSIQGVHTLRYNPFQGTGEGGNQSFVTAFVNEDGDGVVLSSLYSRDRVSIYSKSIKAFKSEFELTQEEQEAIEKAKVEVKGK